MYYIYIKRKQIIMKTETMDFKTLPSNSVNGGIQYLFEADNGYGASIVKHDFSYGHENGLWELAVTKHNEDTEGWDIDYSTYITNNVLGHLSNEDVNDTILKIKNL